MENAGFTRHRAQHFKKDSHFDQVSMVRQGCREGNQHVNEPWSILAAVSLLPATFQNDTK